MTKTRNKLKISGLVLTLVMMVSLLGSFSLTALAADGDACAADACAADGCSGTYDNGFCTECDGYEQPTLNADGYYEIDNAGKLYWFAGLINGTLTDGTAQNAGANAVLTADITVNENVLTEDVKLNGDGSDFRVWTPMGYWTGSNYVYYTGTFDGKGYTVSGLYLNDSSAINASLFGFVGEGGIVQNVGMVDFYFLGNENVGGVVSNNNGTVTNCYTIGTVSGNWNVGGVVAFNLDGNVLNCYNTGSVSGSTYVGGLVGYNEGSVQSCYNTGTVSGNECVGGVVGDNFGTVTKCYYHAGTATGGINGTDIADQAEVKAAAQFASGEVAHLLSSAWGQNLDNGGENQGYPVFDGERVYYGYISCATDAAMIYTNDANASETKPEHNMTDATCTAPATCKNGCGYTEGEVDPNAHRSEGGEYCADCGEHAFITINGELYSILGDITNTGIRFNHNESPAPGAWKAGDGYLVFVVKDSFYADVILYNATIDVSEIKDVVAVDLIKDNLDYYVYGTNNIYGNNRRAFHNGTVGEDTITNFIIDEDAVLNIYGDSDFDHLVVTSGEMNVYGRDISGDVGTAMQVIKSLTVKEGATLTAIGGKSDMGLTVGLWVRRETVVEGVLNAFTVNVEETETKSILTVIANGDVVLNSDTFNAYADYDGQDIILSVPEGARLTVPMGIQLDLDSFTGTEIDGELIVEGTIICTHEGGEADCVSLAVCDRCKQSYGELDPNAHDIVIDKGYEPTCSEKGLSDGQHCSRCNGATIDQEEIDETDHSFSDPSCHSASACVYCGLKMGAALHHDWIPSETDGKKECSVCGTVFLPDFEFVRLPYPTLEDTGFPYDEFRTVFPDTVQVKYENGRYMVKDIGADRAYVYTSLDYESVQIDLEDGWWIYELEERVYKDTSTDIYIEFEGDLDDAYWYVSYLNCALLNGITLSTPDNLTSVNIFYDYDTIEFMYGIGDIIYTHSYIGGIIDLQVATLHVGDDTISINYFGDGSVNRIDLCKNYTDWYYYTIGDEGWTCSTDGILVGCEPPEGYEDADVDFFTALAPTTINCSHEKYLEADCLNPERCSVCGIAKKGSKPLGHDIVVEEAIAPTCTEYGYTEWSYCSKCGEVITASETIPATDHSRIDATCTDPSYCEICKEILSDALGHSWLDATYEDPKTCCVCGETEGEPLLRPSESESESETEAMDEVTGESGSETESGVEGPSETETEAKSETESEPKVEVPTETESKVEAPTETETESKTEKPTESDGESNTEGKGKSGGCSSSIGIGLIGIVAVASAMVVFRKKED